MKHISLAYTLKEVHHENQSQENEKGEFVTVVLQERLLIDRGTGVLMKGRIVFFLVTLIL